MAVKGWTMAAVAVVVAAGTYFTLEAMYPPSKNGDVDLRVMSPDSVFGNAPVDADVATGAAVAQLETAKTPDANDRALDAAMAPSEDDLVVTDESLAADEPEPTASPAADATTGDDETTASEAGAGDDSPAAVSADEAAATPTPAVATPTPAPIPTATATPKPSATPAATAQPKPRAAPARTPAPRVSQWWGPESDANLSVIYAGSAAYTRAIVLMFNGAFQSAASAQQNLRVRDASGRAVAGNWEVGTSNRRMLVFPVTQNGIYTVTIGAGLTDQGGRSVGKEQQGPVRVQ